MLPHPYRHGQSGIRRLLFGVACFLVAGTANATAVKSVTLINVDKEAPVAGFDPIKNGATIDLNAMPSRNLRFRVNTDATTPSVRMTANKVSIFDNSGPITRCLYIAGNGDPRCLPLVSGSQTVTFQPYADRAGTKPGPLYSLKVRVAAGTSTVTAPPATSPVSANKCSPGRGMWVWSGPDIIFNAGQQDSLISQAKAAGVSDLYIYLVASNYKAQESQIRSMLRKVNAAGLKAWGLEGYRGYFSDSYGPSGFYDAVNALIAYNGRVAANERFVGFTGDNEPNDIPGFPRSFHDGLTDSSLSTRTGGVWYGSQAEDRDRLMQDWLKTYTTVSTRLHNAGLLFSSAFPNWLDDYYGEPITVSNSAGGRDRVLHRMMSIVDQYLIMSYSTNASNVTEKVINELKYANTLPADKRPGVYGGIETHTGVGAGISYGDTAGKNTKTAVLADIDSLTRTLKASHPSFCGLNIHDWEGWRVLRQ